MSRIFLSHSSLNDSEAIEIRDWIEANGWAGEVFLDLDPERGLVAGVKWETALKQAVHRCEAVLPLISKEWLASKWCLSEVGTARFLGKHIIPILIDDTDLSAIPADMTSEQIVDRKGDPQWAIRLKEGLKRANLDPKTFYFEEGRRPYPGLMALTEKDAAIFFGRDAQIVRGLDRLRSLKSGGIERLMVILGASGSGKSSFLRAGLWPRLDRDDRNFLPIAVIRPELAVLSGKLGLYQALSETANTNSHRKSNLTARNLPTNKGDIKQYVLDHGLQSYLAGLRDASRVPLLDGTASGAPTVVLCVDQAEELFGPVGSSEADLFLDILTKALLNDKQLIVIFSMRSDAYPQLQADARLTDLSQYEANLFNLAPMKQGSYRTVIEGPAKLVMPNPLIIEPQLTDALLEDSSGADALPLLAFTLERLYENYGHDGDLTLEEYKKMGRLEGAIEAAVNDSFTKAFKNNIVKDKSEFENGINAAFIPHLADVNDADQFVRRVAAMEQLPSHTHDVIGLLADQHLLIKDRRGSDNGDKVIVEVAHEALLREWSLLRGWLEEEKDSIRTIGAISRSAKEWEKNGLKDEWLVHTGDRLNEALKLSMRDDVKERFGDIEKKYLATALEKQVKYERSNRKKKILIFILTLVAMLIAGFALLNFFQSSKMKNLLYANQNLVYRNYLSNADLAKEQNRSHRFLHYTAKATFKAVEMNINELSNRAFSIHYYFNIILSTIFEHERSVNGAILNQGETRILTWSSDGIARLWDATNGSSVGQPIKHDRSINGGVFNKDGTRILTWSEDGTARLWDAINGLPIAQLEHDSSVNGAVFNEDETRILTWSEDGTARLWDAIDVRPILRMNHDHSINGVVFNKDGTRILTWSGGFLGSTGGTAWLWDAIDGRLILRMNHDHSINGVVFNKDGTRILTWSENGTARLWNVTNGSSVGQPMKHDGSVNGAVFNEDETRILTWGTDGTARLWNATDGSSVGQPMKHDSSVNGAVFNEGETRILTWSSDGTARLWDTTMDGAYIGQSMKHDDRVNGAVFSQGGTRILTWSSDGTARLWYVTDESTIGQSMKHDDSVWGAVFNEDETRILMWSEDGTVRLWDTRDGSPIGQLMKHDDRVNGAIFTRDETWILTWSSDGTVRLWDATDGSSIGQPIKHDRSINGVVFNEDGTRILTWSSDGTARLWDAIDGLPIAQLKHDSSVNGAVFNEDETRILTWSEDGTARLWDAIDVRPILRMNLDPSISGAVFNEDETRILTWGTDGTARLWNATDGSSVGQPMKHESSVNGAIFSRDESRILTWSGDFLGRTGGMARLWDARDGSPIGQPMKHDRSISGGAFNEDETRILTWSADGTARLWNVTDGSSVGQPMKHDDRVNGAIFSRDEIRILTWSADGTVRLWDARDGSPIGQPMKHDDRVNGAIFNQDESRILAWSADGTARFWDIEVDEDFPSEHIPLMIKVATGTSMDDFGNVSNLSKRKWEEYRKEYIDVAEKHINTCNYKSANIYLNHQKPDWGR